jgi:L-rhamnose-H+ transport protein
MTPNPLLGVLFHWLGGLSSASFYVPYRGVRRWSWEIFWLTGGIFSWLLAPWFFAAIQTRDLMGVMHQVPGNIAGLCVLFGVLWGFGGLTYGLTMRYLGLSLGMAVVLGLCTVFGTLIPPIVQGDFAEKLLNNASGRIILLGLLITLAGIVVVALAGARKDAALSEDAKKAVIAEFDFKKGVAVAIFSGIMSACFAFGLAAGEPIKALSAAAGTGPLWTGLPVLCLVMFGGLLTNGVWCGFVAWYFQFFFYTGARWGSSLDRPPPALRVLAEGEVAAALGDWAAPRRRRRRTARPAGPRLRSGGPSWPA